MSLETGEKIKSDPQLALTRGKTVIREAIVGGTVEKGLTQISNALAQLQEICEALVAIVGQARLRLERQQVAATSQAGMASSWQLILKMLTIPQFQELVGSLLAKALQEDSSDTLSATDQPQSGPSDTPSSPKNAE